ncbi:MAG: sugar phosphate isomerase/epimerase, partial [Oscillibacter sp.]|nr:sugar phosphate isomerase/epimerase [Oscillibacter sp.]
MKIGFNEGCNRFCENHSVLEDLKLCEKYGFDYIDIQSECLDRELPKGLYTLEDLGEFFKTHHLKMLSYNALIFFN